MQGWSKKDIEELTKKAKIRGFVITEKKGKAPIAKKISLEKEWIELNLTYWCNSHAVELKKEHRFNDQRKWRFDWSIPAFNIAIEYEGIFSKKSRHTTIHGYNGDVQKYNSASQMGWKVLRFTATNYKTLLQELNKCV